MSKIILINTTRKILRFANILIKKLYIFYIVVFNFFFIKFLFIFIDSLKNLVYKNKNK